MEQSGVLAQLPVWNVEMTGNSLRIKPKLELVLGTKAKRPNPGILQAPKPRLAPRAGSPGSAPETSWLPALPDLSLLPGEGSSQENGLKEVSSEDCSS